MGKTKVSQVTRQSNRLAIKKKYVPKKQPKGKAKVTATARPPPGMFEEESEAVAPTEASTQASTSAKTSQSSSTEISEVDDDDDKIVKFVMRERREPIQLPTRPKPNMKMSERLTCHGLNDFQVNGFLYKVGYRDILNGWACAKGNTVVLKAGYFRVLITPDFKNHAMPSSMTSRVWEKLSIYRQWGLDIYIFVTREYCNRKFIKGLRGNSRIPSDGEIIKNYCYEAIKVNGKTVGWKYKPSHTALLHIRETNFTVFDVNVNDWADLKEKGNKFVVDFLSIVSRRVLPRICKNLSLDITDIRKKYKINKCYFPMGVDNSCALYLLFVLEQSADDQVNLDMNYSPSLAQLYYHKVVHFVGGGGEKDFDSMIRANPDWMRISRPFLFQPLLNEVKTGGTKLSIPELKMEMKRISKELEYMAVW